MKIKDEKRISQTKRLRFLISFFLNRKTKVFFWIVFSVFLFVFGLLIGGLLTGFFGTLDNPSPRAVKAAIILSDILPGNVNDYTLIARENIHIPLNFIEGLFAEPEKISIDVPFMEFQKIEYKRKEALDTGMLITEDDDFVNGQLTYGGDTKKIDLRLKGDIIDHLKGDKWSFRVKMDGEETLFGMKTFSLQHPRTRNYINEWIFHKALKREGIIGLRYEFVDVTLNGRHLGIYALEEHFEKRLVEDNERREGPILSFNEDLDIESLQYFNERITFETPDIKLYKPGKTLSDPALYSEFIVANDLLESFRDGKLNTCEVFDCILLSRYFALLDILGAQHAAKYGDLKFYYNPITSLLEPIGFDAEMIDKPVPKFADSWQNYSGLSESASMFKMIFEDEEFFRLYVSDLERMSEPGYMDDLFIDIGPELDRNLGILYSDYPHYSYSNEIFYQNQEDIRKLLDPPKGVYAYFNGLIDDALVIEVGSPQQIPVEIVSLNYGGKSFYPEGLTRALYPAEKNSVLNYERFTFLVGENMDVDVSADFISNATLSYRLIGSRVIRNETIFSWARISGNGVENDLMRTRSDLASLDFLVVDGDSIFIKDGYWVLDDNVVIPAGFTVFATEGTTLDFKNGSKIISHSRLEFLGSKEDPIRMVSTDGTGQGLVVIGAEGESIFEFVIFDGLSEPHELLWSLTCPLTFYESDVRFKNCVFLNSNSEDSLNIVRSDFEIKDSIFNNSFADCFDSDFSRGIFDNTIFVDCGNDGMDFSGSTIDVSDVIIIRAGDKGLSAGEKSVVDVKDFVVDGAVIGVASKDGSRVSIENLRISDSDYGIAAYKKKPEYGYSSINISNLRMEEDTISELFFIEEGAVLILDGVKHLGDKKDAYSLFYGDS